MEERHEGFRLSPQQDRVWMLRKWGPTAFCSACCVMIVGELDPARLRAALSSIVQRYEILRTAF